MSTTAAPKRNARDGRVVLRAAVGGFGRPGNATVQSVYVSPVSRSCFLFFFFQERLELLRELARRSFQTAVARYAVSCSRGC